MEVQADDLLALSATRNVLRLCLFPSSSLSENSQLLHPRALRSSCSSFLAQIYHRYASPHPAPLFERFNVPSYGKHKTWIVSSLMLCCIAMLLLGWFAEKEKSRYQRYTAAILTVCVLCIASKDIATDSLAICTLPSGTVSLISFIGDETGKLITLPLFLACISSDLFKEYGMRPLMSVSGFIGLTALIGMVVALFVHFWLDES